MREYYQLRFTIQDLPKSINSLGRKFWAIQAKHSRDWKLLVWDAVRNSLPQSPIRSARLTLTRHSSAEMDFDNLVISFKPVIDGIVEAGVLAQDNRKVIKKQEYFWVKSKRNQGFITVEVEEV